MAQRPANGGDPYFYCRSHRFYVHNGTENLTLDAAPRVHLRRVAQSVRWLRRDAAATAALVPRQVAGVERL